jgi:FMN reductase
MNSATLRIIGISGSLREGSHTRQALQIALQGAQELGAKTAILDLADYNLPLCDGNKQSDHPGVLRLQSEVQRAQGILLGTPEYHSGVSGVLKNALDLMGFDEFGGKMLGLVGVSGGSLGAIHALDSLRTIGRALHAWVVPQQASIPQAWKAFNPDGSLKDAQLEQRLKDVGRQVARFAYLHTDRQIQEFVELWEKAPTNPGG